jgi:hypothetical protein
MYYKLNVCSFNYKMWPAPAKRGTCRKGGNGENGWNEHRHRFTWRQNRRRRSRRTSVKIKLTIFILPFTHSQWAICKMDLKFTTPPPPKFKGGPIVKFKHLNTKCDNKTSCVYSLWKFGRRYLFKLYNDFLGPVPCTLLQEAPSFIRLKDLTPFTSPAKQYFVTRWRAHRWTNQLQPLTWIQGNIFWLVGADWFADVHAI